MKTSILTICCVISLFLGISATATVRTWDNGGIGTSWDTTGNWDPDGYDVSDDLIVLSGSPTAAHNVYTDLGGSITLNGPATVVDFSSGTNRDFYVGNISNGRLDVLNGAEITNTHGSLGSNSGSNGTATVSGIGSMWTNNGGLYVGDKGTGTLSITNAGEVSNTIGYLGYNSGSSGDVTVTGAGSKWTNSGELVVGSFGTCTLSITNAGAVSNTAGYLGSNSGGSGDVTVSGIGSTWTNSNELYVSYIGTGTLSITNGGEVSNTDGYLGYFGSSSSSGEVTVSGAGSKWTNSGELYVGYLGTGTLSITNAGAVSNTTGYLGYNSGGSGDVTVSGAGATWTNSGILNVGYLGTGTLSIADGGEVSNTDGYLGDVTSSSGDVTVSGAGATWTNSGELNVGYNGTGTLSITDGGEVSNTTGYLGSNSGGSGDVTVSGIGSMWTNNGELNVGYNGTGVLTVGDGGAVNVDAILRIGRYSGSNGTVNLEGGSLTASNVVAGNGTAAFNWTGGTLGITSSSGLSLNSGGILGDIVSVGAGKGLDVTNDTKVYAGTKLAVNDGRFSTDTLQVNGGKAQLINGVIDIHDTFEVLNDGVLEIIGQDLTLTTAPLLYESELVLRNTNLSAPSMTPSADAKVYLDSGMVSVDGNYTNYGVLVMGNSGPATVRGDYLVNNGGVVMGKGTIQAELINGGGGNMGFSGDTFFTEDVQNDAGALLAISGGAGATFYEDVENNGELRVSQACTATYFGSVSGSGTFTGTGTSYLEGDMRPGASPGTMHFEGDVVFGLGAGLIAELDATENDLLDVDGLLSLGGTLDVELYNGFDPVNGDTFNILDWGTLDGTFGNINLPGLSGGLTWDTSNLYNTGELSVVPEPAAILLLIAGLSLIRRRK